MFIKEVIIDGFKSYANRTVISGWDSSFNAITGLNGTGKSNILDSICFVLGISNLSQVRAANLQELVYKQGQSRVTKASVTVVFDNRETKSSPVGYEQYQEITVTRQVVIGGRNKYLINGVTAQLGRVHNLFHSVQLNVNNPHFLIMQGRITKVINMKPPEILGMIEEAAGTRMYETKKLAAVKTIGKKQAKVDEINKILAEELTPTLEKLRKERSSFMKWTANNTEIDRLDRFCVASRFLEAQSLVDRSQDDVQEEEKKKQQQVEKTELLALEMEGSLKQIEELTNQKNQELEGGCKELEKAVVEKSKELVKHTSIWQHKTDEVQADRKAQKESEKNVKELQKNLVSKGKECEKFDAKAQECTQAHAEISEKLASLQGQLLGFDVGGNAAKQQGTVASQLMEAQRRVAELEAEAKQSAIKATHIKQQVSERKKQAAEAKKGYLKLEKGLAKKQSEVDNVDQKLKSFKTDPARQAQLEEDIERLEERVRSDKDHAESARASLSHLINLEYNHKAFGDKVKGLLVKLVQIKDSKKSSALEITAGGRLFNVVVDTEQTGKALLQKGGLKKRVTIIPLNKISRRCIAPEVVARAQELVGKENVETALSLVGYDKEVQAAMEFAFGSTFVCKDIKTAEKVTYNKDIRKRSVTIQGDLFDPAGTLTGGSAPTSGSVLNRLQKLNMLEESLTASTKELTQKRKEHQRLAAAQDDAEDLLATREVLMHELQLLQATASQTSYATAEKEVEELAASMAVLEANAKEAKANKESEKKKVKELEQSIKDFAGERKKKQKSMEAEIKTLKKSSATASKQSQEAQQDKDRCELEMEAMKKELESQVEAMEAADEKIAELRLEAESLQKVVATHKVAYDEANERCEAEKTKLQAADRQISDLKSRHAKLAKKSSDIGLEIKKLAHKIARVISDKKDASIKVTAMLKKYEWIASERQFFGKPNTDYDFKATSPKSAESRLVKLNAEQEDLSKKINKKVMGMFEKAEQEYQDLMKKRDIIMKDKTKIEEVIVELDRKKNETLETTFDKVTKDFGSIFSALLPGTSAKLSPPEGGTVLDGLEIRVAFGKVWKDSLSELSGGQRSLLALSLILALLLFKPAPMYILDEIDAALDLSHTQNIGQMLKKHFSQSQFIVVSLKEGMFNNANVIFRTKFVDGVSQVARTVNSSNKAR